jgi:FtsX extracellular domain
MSEPEDDDDQRSDPAAGSESDDDRQADQGAASEPVAPAASVGAPGRRRSGGLRWVMVAAAACAVAVLAGVGIFVFSDDDTDGGTGGSSDSPDGAESAESAFEEADVVLFLDREVTDDQRAAIEATARQLPDVEAFEYLDGDAIAEEIGRLFEEENDAMFERLEENTDLIPTAYVVMLTSDDSATVEEVITSFEDLDGVTRATPAGEGLAFEL